MWETLGERSLNKDISYTEFFEQQLKLSEYDEEEVGQGLVVSENQEHPVRAHISRLDEPELNFVSFYGDMPLDVALEYTEGINPDGLYSASIHDETGDRLVISQVVIDDRQDEGVALPWISPVPGRYDDGIENLDTLLNGAKIDYQGQGYCGMVERAVNNMDGEGGIEQVFNNLPPIPLEQEVDTKTLEDIYRAVDEAGLNPRITVSGEDVEFKFRKDNFFVDSSNPEQINSGTEWLEEQLGITREGEYTVEFMRKSW